MILPKIDPDIVSTKKNVLQYQRYSVASRFEVFSGSAIYLYPVVAKFGICSLYVH